MALKTPLPDEVFQKWIKSYPSDKIEKQFGRKPSNISPMEVVGKEIVKTPALLFRSIIKSTTPPKSKDDTNFYSYKDLSKEKFYKFNKKVPKDAWKEKDVLVHLYEKIQEVQCPECKGRGALGCKKCNGAGSITCDNCKDDKKLQCKECKGSGNLEMEFEIYNEGGKIDKAKRKVSCYSCHGKGKLLCWVCGGDKKIVCDKCKGSGGDNCKQCLGPGVVYKLPSDMVPFVSGSEVYFFWNEEMEKEMIKSKSMKGNEFSDLLEKSNVTPIKVSNLKDLDQKKLEEELGFWHKDASKQINVCKKSFEDRDKSKEEEPKFPIEIYPVQKIDIDTYKGKKFSIYSIGSANGYVVFDLGF